MFFYFITFTLSAIKTINTVALVHVDVINAIPIYTRSRVTLVDIILSISK